MHEELGPVFRALFYCLFLCGVGCFLRLLLFLFIDAVSPPERMAVWQIILHLACYRRLFFVATVLFASSVCRFFVAVFVVFVAICAFFFVLIFRCLPLFVSKSCGSFGQFFFCLLTFVWQKIILTLSHDKEFPL